MSKKVIGVAAGEAHTLALTDDGSVFSWGRGTFGRLGTGREEDELSPVPISFNGGRGGGGEQNEQPKFVGAAAGAYHSLALQDDGSVWSWGYNIYSQLGHGEENASVPSLVERFQELGAPESLSEGPDQKHDKKPLKVCSIKAGGMMSLAIDSLGALWVWGNSPQPGKSEDGEEFCLVTSSPPLPLRDFHGRTVVKVACGNEHIVAAVTAGETFAGGNLVCYSWGNNSHGQLGLGDKENRPRPVVVPAFSKDSPWTIYEIACGAAHSAVLTRGESVEQEAGSKCWTFGLGDNGQLGHGTTGSTLLPEPVAGLPPDAILISLDCGLFHTSVVSSAGEVWSWGMERGLGLCPDACFAGNDAGDALNPLRITCTETTGGKFAGPVQVACGAAHTVLVAEDGRKLWAWGRGRSGVLGRGQEADSYVPCAVTWPPLDADFKEEAERTGETKTSNQTVEAEEVQILREKLALMEQYATVLHVSVFRKPFDQRNLSKLLPESGTFDIWRELEKMMDSAETDELARLDTFYKSVRSAVKDKLMRRRVQEMVKESLVSLARGK
ncbi:ultraviolet-B receptor UVR8 isoform X1 [Iris pallida]|uniref:Ultraviolet-B receptor UVR8 isoform X1 n=1 Tax=Iris pallida TaxID=29817 RepID=A0AAX6F5X6_IRIPA|nr:ultraviolet-B receptor UVR8 isoform X1 [Iris pallida]